MDYLVQPLDLDNLNLTTKKSFLSLTAPKYHCCLEGLDPDGIKSTKIIAIGASHQQKPIGLALAGFYPAVKICQLFSLYVDPHYRKQKVGDQLLQTIQTECTNSGGYSLYMFYRKEDSFTPYLEKLIAKHGWAKPTPFMIRCFFDAPSFNPPWYNHPPKLPHGFQEFPWKELTSEERETLKRMLKERKFRPSVSPLYKENLIEPINSLGLRYEGKIVGWMVTHRIAPDTIVYTSLYVNPEHQFTGYAIRLLADSCKLQQKSHVKWALFEINLADIDSSWKKFVDKRLAPYAQNVDTVYQVWKALRQDLNLPPSG